MLCERALDRQTCAHRAFRIVLLADRIAKQRHDPVAELFGDVPAHLRHRRRGGVEIAADEIAPVLGVEFRRYASRADKVAKHDGQVTTLGGCGSGRRLREWDRRRDGSGRGPGQWCLRYVQSGDRFEHSSSMTPGDADLLEVRLRQLRQDFDVDVVFAKYRLVLAQPEASQSNPDAHCRVSQ